MRKAALLLLLAAAPFAGAQATCDPDHAPANCTVGQAYEFYWNASAGVKQVAEDVVNSNRSQDAPDGFAARIHNSYQDYLNLFAFAINKVEESTNGQALIVRFNPLREGSQVLGFTLTAAKPTIAETVKNAIPETGRADVLLQVQGKQSNLEDLSLSASYALETANCGVDRDPSERCYGRAPSSYRGLLSHALAPIFAASMTELISNDDEIDFIANSLTDAAKQRLLASNQSRDVFANANIVTDMKPDADVLSRVKTFAQTEATAAKKNQSFFADKNLERVASLIDNQPQVSATGSYRAPGKYGGPKQTALTIEAQFGSDNMNSLRASCPRGAMGCLQTALKGKLDNGISTLKWVVTATYKRDDSYSLADLGLDKPVAGFTPINLKSGSELNVKGQGGAILPTQVGAKSVRYDISLEGQRIRTGGKTTTNRWVATATVTVPLGETMSLPVSLNYANKPEFLGPQTKGISAHLGLTYRIPGFSK